MKLWTDVLGSTLMVTSPKKMSCFPSADCHFGGILGPMSAMFLSFLRTIQYFLMKFCRYYSDGHYTNKKIKKNLNHVLLCWQAILCYFWIHFGICSPISFSWEPFNIFPWKGVQMFLVLLWWSIHFFWPHVHLCWGAFWGIFGPIFSCSSISWELCNILLWNCVHMCLVVLWWSFHQKICLVPLCWGPGHFRVFFILAYFGIHIFLYFLKTV